MKVLHVCETMLGGVGTYLNEIVPLQGQALGSDKIQVLVPEQDLIQIPNIPFEQRVTFARPSRWRGLLHLVVAFLKIFAAFRPDVIHVHSAIAGGIVRLMAWPFPVKIVYSPHCWATERCRTASGRRLIAFLERILALATHRIIAVSQDERRKGIAMGIPAAKIKTVYNGIKEPPPTFAPVAWEDKRLNVLFVGRLDRQKGIDVLCEAVEGLEDRISVRIAGDRIVDDMKVPSMARHLEPLGWLPFPKVWGLMQACDVLVMPSRWEGLPFVTIEAMRLAKPVIGTTVGGIPEAVVDGQTGRLFASEDAAALRAILLSLTGEQIAAYGRGGRALFMEKFTSNKSCAGALDVYRSLIAPQKTAQEAAGSHQERHA